MQPLDIRHNRLLAIGLLVVGALLFLVSLLTQQWISVVAGAILAVLGVLMTVNPLVRIGQSEVQLRSPIGMTLKRFPVTSPGDLAVDGKALLHVPTGKRIAALGFGVNAADVDTLRAQLPTPR